MPKTSADYTRPSKFVVPYFFLQISCFVSLSTLLFTFQRIKGIHRDATLKNMLLIFIINSLFNSLLIFNGNLQSRTKEPSFGLCLVNGSAVMGGSSGLAGSAFSVVFRVFTRIVASQGYAIRIIDSKWFSFTLLALPWALWGGVASASVAISLRNRTLIHRAVFYCTVDEKKLEVTTTAITASVTGFTIIIQLMMFGLLIYHRRALRKVLRPASSSVVPSSSGSDQQSNQLDEENNIFLQPGVTFPPDSPQEGEESSSSAAAAAAAEGGTPGANGRKSGQKQSATQKRANKPRQLKGLHGGLVLRIGLFMFCVVLAFVISIVVADNFTSVTGDLAIASIGPAVFLIFASQDDVLRAWGLMKPKRDRLNSISSPSWLPSPDPHPNTSSIFNVIDTARSWISFKYLSRSQPDKPIGQGRDLETDSTSFQIGQIEITEEEPFVEILRRDGKSTSDLNELGLTDIKSATKSCS
ncbi:hypothetical protein [Phaffia rhodozyma]|uniref:Uncharacterized protein n=1 Tax=Phaffia rhodozyma TaxID=264483 RepID=A0A0F7SVK4_PHARH|nr:hypothetical protein [Phaffia rhodozyma]